jgi:hypothetical protein
VDSRRRSEGTQPKKRGRGRKFSRHSREEKDLSYQKRAAIARVAQARLRRSGGSMSER